MENQNEEERRTTEPRRKQDRILAGLAAEEVQDPYGAAEIDETKAKAELWRALTALVVNTAPAVSKFAEAMGDIAEIAKAQSDLVRRERR